MNKKRGPFEYKKERDEDLLRVYRSSFKIPHSSRKELIKIIAKSQASRFWVSEINAEFIIRRLLNGHSIKKFAKTRLRKEMYYEIYRRVKIYLKQKKHATISEAVTTVVNSPAPSFYLTEESVSVILHAILKNKRDNRKKNL